MRLMPNVCRCQTVTNFVNVKTVSQEMVSIVEVSAAKM